MDLKAYKCKNFVNTSEKPTKMVKIQIKTSIIVYKYNFEAYKMCVKLIKNAKFIRHAVFLIMSCIEVDIQGENLQSLWVHIAQDYSKSSLH